MKTYPDILKRLDDLQKQIEALREDYIQNIARKEKVYPHVIREQLESLAKKMKAKPSRANGYQPWTPEQDQELLQNYDKGETIGKLSKTFKRTPGAIRSRIKKLRS